MTQQPATSITSFDDHQVADLQIALDTLKAESLRIRYEDVVPTTSTLKENEIVVFDDGVNKRIYTITRKGNLGFVTLT